MTLLLTIVQLRGLWSTHFNVPLPNVAVGSFYTDKTSQTRAACSWRPLIYISLCSSLVAKYYISYFWLNSVAYLWEGKTNCLPEPDLQEENFSRHPNLPQGALCADRLNYTHIKEFLILHPSQPIMHTLSSLPQETHLFSAALPGRVTLQLKPLSHLRGLHHRKPRRRDGSLALPDGLWCQENQTQEDDPTDYEHFKCT